MSNKITPQEQELIKLKSDLDKVNTDHDELRKEFNKLIIDFRRFLETVKKKDEVWGTHPNSYY